MLAHPGLVAAADVSYAAGAGAEPSAADTQMAEAAPMEQVVQAGASTPAAQPAVLETPPRTAAAAADKAQQQQQQPTSAGNSATVVALAAPPDAAMQQVQTISADV